MIKRNFCLLKKDRDSESIHKGSILVTSPLFMYQHDGDGNFNASDDH